MSKFTPGPWHAGHLVDDSTECNCRYVFDGGAYMGGVAEVYVQNEHRSIAEGSNDCPPLEEAKANMRLIAAAPEMFEMLCLMKEDFEMNCTEAEWDKLRALFGKIEGN